MAQNGSNTKKRSVLRTILFVLEIMVLVLLLGGLFLYRETKSTLDLIEQPVLDESEIIVNESVQKMTGFTTYALFGIDHRDKNMALAGENSDTMIIASINNDTQEVRLVSLYRDTFLNIGSDTYAKANAAYAMGGPEQAISMLNTNLDLDISDYVTVDFTALTKAVDALDGLDVPLSYAEIVHLNNYSKEVSEETGEDYTEVPLPEEVPENQEEIIGTYHLNGVQVTSYCRIRYTSSMDMGRTERQRRVIQLIGERAKSVGITTIYGMMQEVFPLVQTSLRSNEILNMLPTLLNYSLANTTGFPEHYKFSDVSGSIIVCTNLTGDVSALHEFLYGEEDYEPSSVVVSRAARILEIVGGQEALLDEAPVVDDTNDSYIYQDDTLDDNSYSSGNWDSSYTYDSSSWDTISDGSWDSSYSDNSYSDYNYSDDSYSDNGDYDNGYDDAGYDYSDGYDSGVTDGGTGSYDDSQDYGQDDWSSGGEDYGIDGGSEQVYSSEETSDYSDSVERFGFFMVRLWE